MFRRPMAAELASIYSHTRSARKIAVVDLGFLGDSVHLVPALWLLKRAYPEATVHVLTTPVGGEVLALAPCVDRAWSFPLGSPSPPWWRHWPLIRRFRQERFDLAFNFTGADRGVLMTALSGARWRVAHAAGRNHFWNRLLVPHWVPRRDPLLPVFEQRRQILAACGLPLEPVRWDLAIPAAARRQAEVLVPAGSVHLSINASSPLKEWPLPHWIAFSRRFLAEHPERCLVASGSAGARERERVEKLAAEVRNERLIPLPAGLPIAILAAVLQRCRAHLGADSGVLHLAVAVGVPTLSLFRQYLDASAWIPQGPAHRTLVAACRCVNQRAQPCLQTGHAECLAGLDPECVLRTLDTLVSAPPADGAEKPRQGSG